MQRYESLTQILTRARDRDRGIRFIDGEKDETVLTYGEVWESAIAMLGALQRRGMRAGDELVIFTRSNEQFVVAFWAAILGGIVPVPVAVGISDEHRFKLFRILGQLNNGTLFTEKELLERLRAFADEHDVTGVRGILASRAFTNGDLDTGVAGQPCSPDSSKIAFIQYSSGSTSDPKGVCLTHDNLTANICGILEGIRWNEDERSLSWMPLTHDMGLIGYHLCAVSAGMDHAIMDTGVFVRRPLLWLEKASELRSTQLCSPNFGYKHFLKLFARKGIERLDLSAVKLILNGAEPISWDLCEEFLTAMAPYGLKRTAMFPVYGLAEATLAVTFPTLGSEYSRILVHRHSLKIGAPYESCNEGDADAVSFLKVGRPIRYVELRIAGDEDEELPDGRVGHIHIRGENVTAGIYNDDAATAAIFADGGWLRTGDCGVIVDGELVITGRSKDIIIVNGQNYYPHDIEEIIAQIDDLDLGKVVVAGVSLAASQTEELLAFVLFRQDVESFRPVADSVRAIVGEHTGLEIDHVIPVNRIPKTTSGKVQRTQLANAYLDGEYGEVVAALQAGVESDDDLDDDPLVRELELICREFSKERRIGPDDNLFEVGVSSLTLT
ncbi:MAG: AMP-binding protein, partial [Gammaproteobacteria bacterium]|nr:AMP-binding protein [Gammaproteobacteria bacterium]